MLAHLSHPILVTPHGSNILRLHLRDLFFKLVSAKKQKLHEQNNFITSLADSFVLLVDYFTDKEVAKFLKALHVDYFSLVKSDIHNFPPLWESTLLTPDQDFYNYSHENRVICLQLVFSNPLKKRLASTYLRSMVECLGISNSRLLKLAYNNQVYMELLFTNKSRKTDRFIIEEIFQLFQPEYEYYVPFKYTNFKMFMLGEKCVLEEKDHEYVQDVVCITDRDSQDSTDLYYDALLNMYTSENMFEEQLNIPSTLPKPLPLFNEMCGMWERNRHTQSQISNNTTIIQRMNTIEEEISEMKHEMKEEISEMKREMKEEISEMKEEISEMKREMKEEISEMKEEIKQTMDRVMEFMQQMAKEWNNK